MENSSENKSGSSEIKREVVCPQCHSNQLSANQKGYNTNAALLGSLLGTGGNYSGLALGMAGSDKIMITCLQCGSKFPPGNGSIKTVDVDGSETIEKQHVVDKEKKGCQRVAWILLAIFIVFIVIIFVFLIAWLDN